MLNKTVEKALNNQIEVEHFSSLIYLAMASWAETKGYNGAADFLYLHSEEEREHMLKLFHYVNDRGGHAIVPNSDQPKIEYDSLQAIFEEILSHERFVTAEINKLVGICYDEKDYTTQNFLQWYVEEQIEEESLFSTILDKLNLLGGDKASLYLFDSDLEKMAKQHATLQE
jgi:ferritin